MTTTDDVREQVRLRYAAAATTVQTSSSRTALAVVDGDLCCGPVSANATPANGSCCGGGGAADPAFGAGLYSAGEQDELPVEAVMAVSGAVIRLRWRTCIRASGCLIWVPAAGSMCCCRRGGLGHRVRLRRGHDRRDARPGAGQRGQGRRTNVEFVKGPIEDIPLPDGSIDVVISNCVINLSTDKPAVIAEMFRVLTPGRSSWDLRCRRRGPTDSGRSG